MSGAAQMVDELDRKAFANKETLLSERRATERKANQRDNLLFDLMRRGSYTAIILFKIRFLSFREIEERRKSIEEANNIIPPRLKRKFLLDLLTYDEYELIEILKDLGFSYQ